MRLQHLAAAGSALLLAGTLVAGTTTATSASSQQGSLGTRSLAQVLAADGHHFDHRNRDFDILDKLVTRVLNHKPHSTLAVLADGNQKLTAFLPTDGAFRRTAKVILGHRYNSERVIFRKLWHAAGVHTTEQILLSHLVEGRTLTAHRLREIAPGRLHTMEGSFVRIRLHDGFIWVLDESPDSPDAHVFPGNKNINKGNRQIGHGVNWVLSPIL